MEQSSEAKVRKGTLCSVFQRKSCSRSYEGIAQRDEAISMRSSWMELETVNAPAFLRKGLFGDPSFTYRAQKKDLALRAPLVFHPWNQ